MVDHIQIDRCANVFHTAKVRFGSVLPPGRAKTKVRKKRRKKVSILSALSVPCVCILHVYLHVYISIWVDRERILAGMDLVLIA